MLLKKKSLHEYLLVGIAVLAVLVFLYFLTRFFFGKADSLNESLPIVPPLHEEKVSPTQIERGQAIKVVPEDAYQFPEVIYSENTFSPSSIALKSDHCVLRIINKSSEELIIRLSPHSEKDNIGFHYSPIPPGQSLAIDPRYGQSDASFHNHKKPNQTFRVHLGRYCL